MTMGDHQNISYASFYGSDSDKRETLLSLEALLQLDLAKQSEVFQNQQNQQFLEMSPSLNLGNSIPSTSTVVEQLDKGKSRTDLVPNLDLVLRVPGGPGVAPILSLPPSFSIISIPLLPLIDDLTFEHCDGTDEVYDPSIHRVLFWEWKDNRVGHLGFVTESQFVFSKGSLVSFWQLRLNQFALDHPEGSVVPLSIMKVFLGLADPVFPVCPGCCPGLDSRGDDVKRRRYTFVIIDQVGDRCRFVFKYFSNQYGWVPKEHAIVAPISAAAQKRKAVSGAPVMPIKRTRAKKKSIDVIAKTTIVKSPSPSTSSLSSLSECVVKSPSSSSSSYSPFSDCDVKSPSPARTRSSLSGCVVKAPSNARTRSSLIECAAKSPSPAASSLSSLSECVAKSPSPAASSLSSLSECVAKSPSPAASALSPLSGCVWEHVKAIEEAKTSLQERLDKETSRSSELSSKVEILEASAQSFSQSASAERARGDTFYVELVGLKALFAFRGETELLNSLEQALKRAASIKAALMAVST